MSQSKAARAGYVAGLAVLLAFCVSLGTRVSAQEGEANAPPTTTRQMPIRHAPGTKLTEQQERGAGLFIQRCALCHLAKSFGAGGSKYCCVASLGPSLRGMFKNMDADQEQAMRQIILNGGPTLMPGWKYGLSSQDIDDIISYLKTLE